MSGAEYTMDVYVTDGATGTEISNIVVNKVRDDEGQTDTGKVDIGNTDTNTFNFTNTYVQEAGTGTNPTDPDPTYNKFGSLNVSKRLLMQMVQQQLLTMSSLSQQHLHSRMEQMQTHLAESRLLMEILLHLLRAEHTHSS